jgi:sigma-B regulation protein RsbU (phosphoserine phosphatase)
MFGLDRMVEALNRNAASKPEILLEKVRKAVDDYVGDAEQFDDLTMLCMEYKGKEK